MSKLIFLTFLLVTNLVSAQSVDLQYKGNGEYQFSSSFPNADLHFYLFGDGYHSFVQHPSHEYHFQNVPTNAICYRAKPYDDEDIDEISVGNPTNGNPNPNNTSQVLQNKIEVKKSWNLIPSKETYLILMFENKDEETQSGCVELHFDQAVFFVDENDILDQYNSWSSNRALEKSEYSNEGFVEKYTWEFDDLESGEQRFIYIPVTSLGDLMEEVAVRGVIKYTDNCNTEQYYPYDSNNDGNLDHINDSNYFTLREKLRKYPHDPNCIVTDPYALSTLAEDQTVRYRIWFHNEGEAPAENVNLDFFIDAPVYSMSYVTSSDFCTVNFNHLTNQRAEILFPTINLQGMAQSPSPHYLNTIGFVELEVCFDLTDFSTNFALSEVDIYFDDQAAVSAHNKIFRLINQSLNSNCTIPPDLPEAKQKQDEWALETMLLSPNPTDGVCRIQLIEDFNGEINVFDVVGRSLLRQKAKGTTITVDLSDFPNGLYTIVLKDKLTQRMAKVVLRH